MDPNIVRAKVREIFIDVLDTPSLELTDDLTAADVEGWDSLTHINLIVAVEKEFKVRFTADDVRGLNTVGDLVALVLKKAA